jgi:polar amino acid transport system substrate-binding protein
MSQRLHAAILCIAIGVGWPAAAWAGAGAAPLRISTSDMPPLAIEAAPAAPGAVHEIVSELMRRSKMQARIDFVPWQRALFLASRTTRSAIFPLTRSPEREGQFRWLVQLYQGSFVFMSLKGNGFDVHQPTPDKQPRIGVLRGSMMIKMLKDRGYKSIVEASTVDENARMLRRGMVDAVAGERAIYRASLKRLFEHGYRTSEPIAVTGMWLAGSLDFSEADAAMLQKALKDMIDDGSYARILKKYELASVP